MNKKYRLDGIIALGVVGALALLSFAIALWTVRGGSTPLKNAIRLNALISSDVQVDDNSIYYLESGSLHCLNTKGGYDWNLSLGNSYNYKVSSAGIALWNKNSLRIVDKKTGGETGSTSLSGDILSACVGNTYAAALLSPEHNSTVVITDRDGGTLDTITGLDGLTVLDYGFFDQYTLFWLMTLDSTGSQPTGSISTYVPAQKQNPEISDLEQFVYKVYSCGNYIYTVGTQYMRVYDYKGTEQTDKAVTVYGYTLEAINEDSLHPLMVFIPCTEDSDINAIQDLRLIKDGVSSYMHFPVACMRVLVKNNTIYGFSSDAVAVGHYGSGEVECYKLPLIINDVVGITDDLTAVVSDAGAYYLIKLPE